MNFSLLKLFWPFFGFYSLSNSPCELLFDRPSSDGALPKQDGCHELSDMKITPYDDNLNILRSRVSDLDVQFFVDYDC